MDARASEGGVAAEASVTGPPQVDAVSRVAAPAAAAGPAAVVLGGLSLSHLLNDMIQSLLPAIYPLLKQAYALDFGQIGFLTLAFQLTASLLQPVVGLFTDKRPMPFSLATGMLLSLCGLLLLSHAGSYGLLVMAACLVGLGSAIFHPEASRVARLASGGRYGLAQSVFQVGGNAGSALGPLLAAFIVVPLGQPSVALFAVAALAGFVVLSLVGRWYRDRLRAGAARAKKGAAAIRALPRAKVVQTIAVLLVLIFSKYFYMASLSSYFTFYLIHRFGVSVQQSQLYLFVFLGAVAAGTVAGGPIGDRFGRKVVIWGSILGVLPFTLALPHANLFWTVALTVPIGLILASAMPAILVYAQELLPGRVGLVGGLFFGFAFGMGGLGAAVLGEIADRTSIEYVYGICAFLPAVGLLAAFLPRLDPPKAA
ncbi:MFS transporter [Methylobacterium frigidaeris]|uniref:Fosmidomycin resistance protein n=3 Tax=Methylobacterium frigidaeris TaxID=2038277 RepID=A0AA37M4B8_9HYPH|nr:MFS transporter [Methylobacterium frigidaeris]GJD62290.1 Fosmidomycin resistance protein [Methylobacterium frigidaeris]